ncbi:MAG: Type 1 glutamine amidotransferase-like domain-containing protein [Patescibacteria group bacterium]
MKLILCSEGFSTKGIIDKCVELVGKPKDSINVAVINEAYSVENNNLRWVLNNLNKVKDNFGGNLELVNLLALSIQDIKERIEKSDVIFVLGGHTDYLMSVFNKSEFSKLLPEVLKSKVYVGSSAGSMVLGKRLSAQAYEKIYHEQSVYGISKYLEFIDITIMPHLDNPHFANRREILQDASRNHSGVIYGLRDDSAIVVKENKITTIGSKPYILNKD